MKEQGFKTGAVIVIILYTIGVAIFSIEKSNSISVNPTEVQVMGE